MDFLLILLLIGIGIANSAKKKAKKEGQAKGAQAKAASPAKKDVLPQEAFNWDMPQPETPPFSEGAAVQESFPLMDVPTASGEGVGTGGSLGGVSAEGRGMEGSLSAASSEGVGLGGSLGGGPSMAYPMHVVQPFTEGSHSHVESSMAGDITCPPSLPRRPAASRQPVPAASSARTAYNLAFDRTSLLQGLLYGEILGKPRALRRR